MKIVFVIPGTKITFLENATTPLHDSYTTLGTLKDYYPKKGDQFQVSQVYIRKNGWFQSSLTFKAIGGPIMDNISEKKLALELENNKKALLNEEAEIAKLDSLGDGVEWFFEKYTTQSITPNQQTRKIEEFFGYDKKTKNEIIVMHVPEYQKNYKFFYANNAYRFDMYNSKVFIRSESNEAIKKLKKKIANQPKQGKINSTFRVSLKDIETWEVEIER